MINAYLDWKSKRGTFEAWIPELKQKAELLPTEFIIISQNSCVKGYDMKEKTTIFSNEVKNVKEEEIVARTKSKEVLKGIYDKKIFEDAGLRFHKVITVYEDGVINKYYFSGGSIGVVSDNLKKLNPSTNIIKFDKIIKDDNGFDVPSFINGDKIDIDLLKKVQDTYKEHLNEIETKKDSFGSGNDSIEMPF